MILADPFADFLVKAALSFGLSSIITYLILRLLCGKSKASELPEK